MSHDLPGGTAPPITRRQLRANEQSRAKKQVRALAKAPSRTRRTRRRSHAYSPVFSAVAMLFAGALLVGSTVPANAFMEKPNISAPPVETKEAIATQSLFIASNLDEESVARDGFSVTTYAEMLRVKYGNRTYGFTATSGSVRWPFPNSVTISDGFGERVSPCRGCSSFHKGVDFTPGAGTAIFAVASGTVVTSESSSNGFGTQVAIEHVIKGNTVTSFYAHMQAGSVPLKVGQKIAVGDFVGLVGETGSAVGAHLHLEIWIADVQVDPYAWLKANAVN